MKTVRSNRIIHGMAFELLRTKRILTTTTSLGSWKREREEIKYMCPSVRKFFWWVSLSRYIFNKFFDAPPPPKPTLPGQEGGTGSPPPSSTSDKQFISISKLWKLFMRQPIKNSCARKISISISISRRARMRTCTRNLAYYMWEYTSTPPQPPPTSATSTGWPVKWPSCGWAPLWMNLNRS